MTSHRSSSRTRSRSSSPSRSSTPTPTVEQSRSRYERISNLGVMAPRRHRFDSDIDIMDAPVAPAIEVVDLEQEDHSRTIPMVPDIVIIDIMPTRVLRNQPDMECSICQGTMEATDPIARCGHRFHIACLAPWTANNCPLCRKDFSQAMLDKIHGPVVDTARSDSDTETEVDNDDIEDVDYNPDEEYDNHNYVYDCQVCGNDHLRGNCDGPDS